MSVHADKLRRKAEADAALKTGYYEHADVLALLAENQRYEKALTKIATPSEFSLSTRGQQAFEIAREALAGEDG